MRKLLAVGSCIFCLVVPSLAARNLPPLDEFSNGRAHPDAATAVAGKANGLTRAGVRIPVEARLRVPTFIWPAEDAMPPQTGTEPFKRNAHPEEAAARAHMSRFASLYDLAPDDVKLAVVGMTHDTGRGPIIVKLRQQVNGIEIFREEMNVVMDRDFRLVGIGGYLSSASTPAATGAGMVFRLEDRDVAASALQDLTGVRLRGSDLIRGDAQGKYESFTVPESAGAQLEEPLRVRKVYFHLQSGLVAGYYVEVIARDPATNGTDGYAYVISAQDGSILFRNSLSADASYTYRVWASANGIPFDSPAGNSALPKVNPVNDGYQAPLVGQTDVTIANYPFSMNDPWLPDGATETAGNNVDAYADVVFPDGYGPVAAPATPVAGDFRAQSTSAAAFQHTYSYAEPYHHTQRQAATVQLFFNVNFLHDWFYDAGFDEAAGNAQNSNYGRGGAEGDRLRAEAQDYSGRNNANMLTPADGSPPRMQMYYFDGLTGGPFFEVTSPAAAAGKRSVGTATFGPQTFDVTQAIVRPQPLSACSALTNGPSVAGKIVLVEREPTSGADACSIATKVTNIAAAGAGGIIIVNLSGWPDAIYYPSDPIAGLTTPVLTISYNGAVTIKNELNAGNTVMGRMAREPKLDRDGTIDHQIVAHEWGHYLSNRLIGNGSGLVNAQGRGMGEGWSDFVALLLTVREDDVNVASNATWNGIYPTGTYAFSGGNSGGSNSGYYFGVRRAPYSTDFTKNPFTFRHIQDGEPLPTTAPLRPNGLSNAQFHNTGEIWANMLWECYASLLRDTQGGSPRLTFNEAQTRMKEYLVAALKITPVNPTFVEARDALLAAAAANDLVDYAAFYGAFARRGAGMGAAAPDRYSYYNVPVVESYVSGGEAKVVSHTLADTGTSCDNDGWLDKGETGELSITIRNTGTTALNGMTGTLSVTTSGVTLPSGGAIAFPDSDPFETVTVTVPVAMASGVTGLQIVQFTLQYTHASLSVNPQTTPLYALANADALKKASAIDTVDSPSTLWTTTFGTASSIAPWTRTLSGSQSVWHGHNPSRASDERLESPPLTVSASGLLKIELDHTFSFESYYDGGVIEMARNGGAWLDIGSTAYNGYMYGGTGNPIAGRYAFTGTLSTPGHVTLNPSVIAGDVVRIRFRIGTDSSGGARGWDIDNISFTGVRETPFDQLDADSGCPKATYTRIQTSANPVRTGSMLTITGTPLAAGSPAGTVTFFDGAATLGVVPLSNGSASLSTASLSTGVHALTARYDGSASFLQSTSAPLSQGVDDCNGLPVITYLSPSTSVPVGGSTTLSVSSNSPYAVYEWYRGIVPDRSNPVGTGTSINVTPTASTKYWVRVTNACATINSAEIEVKTIAPARLYTMTPCRLIDTRSDSLGALAPGATRTITPYYGSTCWVQYFTRAVAVNVTVVAPSTDGYLTLYPSAPRPTTSTTSFRVGKTRANNAIVALSDPTPGSFMVYNGSEAPVHFIIDVFGYFY